MKKIYMLQDLFYLDSMHDQRINLIELDEEKVIFYYNDLHYYETNYEDGINNKYYREHKSYISCKVSFIGGEGGYAEVRLKEKLNVQATIYYMSEFIEFIQSNQYVIETIDYFLGYETISINAVLVSEEGYYCEDCNITIPVSKLIYEWS